jgi:hypothetical protein
VPCSVSCIVPAYGAILAVFVGGESDRMRMPAIAAYHQATEHNMLIVVAPTTTTGIGR